MNLSAIWDIGRISRLGGTNIGTRVMKSWCLTLLLLLSATELVTSKMTCGTTVDVTNVGSDISTDSSGLYSKFESLDTSCYDETKSTLLLLQEAVKEGNKCDLEAKRLLTSIDTMCTYLKPLNGYASKFEKVVKLLKLIHKNLDKLTKFADNIPRIGLLRKLIVEKVIPMTLDALELVGKEIRKVVDYETIILKYKKTAKLLWKIDKQGTRACKLVSPLGLSLQALSKTINEVNKPSMIALQTTNQAQSCMSTYCRTRGGKSSCSECAAADSGFGVAKTKVASWKTKMVSCHKELSAVNNLISKLNVVSHLIKFANSILDKIESFIKPINDKIQALAGSVGRIASNMMACCPCGRPNLIGCSISATTRIINLVTCPLDGLTSYLIDNFVNSLKNNIKQMIAITFPKISVKITLPVSHFEISIPSFMKECLFKTSYGKGFTKICGLTDKPFQVEVSASFQIEKQSSLFQGSTSLSTSVKKSCSDALNALVKFGKNLKTCFDRIDNLFFAIPVVGIFAAMTCDPKYKDPDPGINYCPCQSSDDAFINDNGEQPFCVVWHKSWFHSCSKTCSDKKYTLGKDPSGKGNLMSTTNGYPYCDKLKYYCRKGNVNIKNGKIDCDNQYTYLGGSCKVIPNSGYICPITHIYCGSVSNGQSVCWNYRFIECSKDDGHSFPMCTCRNRDSGGFAKGEVVCQTGGESSSGSPTGLKEIGKSFSCFRPLGRYSSIKDDCGSNMFPCVVQTPAIGAYQRCSLSRAEKFWDAHGKKFVIAGAVLLVIGVLVTIGSCVAKQIPAAVGTIILAIIGIVLLICGLVIKTPQDSASNYVKMARG